MWGLLAGLLWLGTFLTLPLSANGWWLPKDMVWMLGSFMLASSPFWNPPSCQTAPNRYLGFFLLSSVALFGWLVCWPQLQVNGTQYVPLIRLPWNFGPLWPALTLFGSVLALDALVRHTDSLRRWDRIALHLVRIGSVLALYAIAQRFNLDPIRYEFGFGSHGQTAPVTVFGNPTITGTFLAICTPLCLMFRDRRYRWGALSLCWAGLLSTLSAISLVAAWLACCLVWMSYRKRWTAIWALVGGLGASLWMLWASPEFFNWGGRVQMWQTAWAFFLRHPLNVWIGYGMGAVGILTSRGFWTFGYLHNEPLQVLFEHGVIGLVLVGLALFVTARRVWESPKSASLWAWVGAALAYGMVACFTFPLRIGTTVMVGIVIWAALEAHVQRGGSHA